MTLQEKLDNLKANVEKSAPKEAVKIMHRATSDLIDSGIVDGVVKNGDTAPVFELKDNDEKIVRLKDFLEKGPVVLSFYRGQWWPYCNLELEALNGVVRDIRSLGADLLTISPQQPEFNRKLIEEKNLSFDLLSDPGNRVAKTYGLVHKFPEDLKKVHLQFGIDLEKYNGDDSWTLPMPGRFIIDRSGIIRYAEVSPDYTVRPEPEEVVEVLKSLLS